MKTGEELINTLSKENREKFLENVRNQKPDKYNNILSNEYADMLTFIDKGFTWEITPEG